MKLLTVGIAVLVALGVSSASFANAQQASTPNINVAAESLNKNPQTNAPSTDKSQNANPQKSSDQQKASEQQKPNDDSEND